MPRLETPRFQTGTRVTVASGHSPEIGYFGPYFSTISAVLQSEWYQPCIRHAIGKAKIRLEIAIRFVSVS